VVLVFPPFGVSTPEAFRWWDQDRGLPTVGDPPSPNDLEAPVSRRYPQLLEIRRELERAGADSAAMTGSGSTVFGLFATRAAARAASDRVRGVGWRSLVTRTATRVQARPG